MGADQTLNELIPFGPDSNCTLDLCPLATSVLQYRPSRAANGGFIAIFGTLLLAHFFQGLYYWQPGHMIAIVTGCILEIIGYAGRIMLYSNPFSFQAFLIQTICITVAPLFYCAAIYVFLSRFIEKTNIYISRFNPRLFYWLFIPTDIICLILQATGGAISASSTTLSSVDKGVAISKAGLILQAAALVVFLILFLDYLITHRRLHPSSLSQDMGKCLFFTVASVCCILARCVYRIVELKDGYFGSNFRHEAMYVWLEGVIMCFAVAFLNMGYPGPAFEGATERLREVDGPSVRQRGVEITQRLYFRVTLGPRQGSQV